MPIEAVIFDMDGVLVESEAYWLKARQDYATSRGLTWTTEAQNEAMGRNTVEWAAVMQRWLKLDESIEAIIDEMIERVIAQYDERMPLRPGALEAVQMSGEHYPVGLASGSPIPIIKHVLAVTGMDQVFQAMFFGDDFENGKPAPDVYLATAEALKIPPERCIGIEDSGNGIRSLKAANMYAVAAPSPGFTLSDEILALADRKIDSMEEFTHQLILEIEAHA